AAWARRDAATVLDLSPDGARLALQREVRPGQRFHLVLRHADGPLAALPLAEVVSVNRAEDGGLRAGLRFVTIRLRERLRLAEFVRGVERGAGVTAASARPVAEDGERSA
ncbi:MAG: PilZ domain-containing protein, partial [Planctomycetes bacterium]|nr:PilZ domain-containing protein [Planctomycetota bacterium]